MPPKKKGKGKKKKGDDDSEMEVKFKQSQHEVDALKDQMAYRRELSRRSMAIADEYREKMQVAETKYETVQSDMKEISSELTKQYKTMQLDLTFKIDQYENELAMVKGRLAQTDQEVSKQKIEYDRMVREKDQEIRKLETKVSNLETSFENLIDINFDNILARLNAQKLTMDKQIDDILMKNKDLLREQNLIPLEM